MRPQRTLLCAVLLSTALVSTAHSGSAIRWQTSLDEAHKLAAQTNRLVLVHFWSETCPPCMRMEREVFTQPDVAAAIDANYVAVKVNVQQHPSTAKKFGVTSWPTDLVLTARDEVVEKSVGFLPPSQYKAKLHQIASHVRSQSSGALAQVPSGQAPALPARPAFRDRPPESVAPRDPPNVSLAQGPMPQESRFARSAAFSTEEPQGYATPPWQQNSPSVARQPAPSRPATASVVPNPSHLYPSPGPLQPGTANRDAGMPIGRETPPTDSAGLGHSAPASTADSSRGSSSTERPVAGNPPLALDGYCPVSLGEKERWVKGNPRFGVIHRGRTYLFAGSEEARRFYKSPDRYSPAASGNDVVAMVEQGQSVPGRREHGAWFDGRVYLFASESAYEKFSREPARYAAAVVDAGIAVKSSPEAGTESQPSERATDISRWDPAPRY